MSYFYSQDSLHTINAPDLFTSPKCYLFGLWLSFKTTVTILMKIKTTSVIISLVSSCIHRADPEYRKYTGALVGLGFDPHTGKALLPDHDSELVFEVDINEDDLIKVRKKFTPFLSHFQLLVPWQAPSHSLQNEF